NRLPALAAAILVACAAGLALAPAPALAQAATGGDAQPAANAANAAPAPDAAKAAAPTPQPPPPAADKEVVENPYGLEALWKGGDFVSRGTLIILVIMSMGSWYIMFVKVYEQAKLFRQARAAQSFFTAGSVTEGAAGLKDGTAFLATVGSTAPFVGLFGTVWGIYHALTAIGIAGQASIDKVAGPVGEALIMTAFGLAVAVPAVLGYNWLVRRNKVAMELVRHFGGGVHMTLLGGPRTARKGA